MSDPKSNRASIPDWQKPNATTSNDADSNSASTSTPSPSDEDQSSTSRSSLLEQATKFLQDDSIREASIDRKISFLESKGLHNDEIDSLLGVSRNPEATSTNASAEPSSPDSATAPSNAANEPEPPTSSPASTSSPSSPPAPTPSSTASTARSAPSSSPRDVPPIITYPEFLVHQSKPPPLVSLQSILYTLYGAAGLGASIYGASEYLVKPMLANLTSARHDLAQTASDNLKKLNEKLEQNVSVIPPQLTARKSTDDASSSEDTDSITSDPTELFHRDVATQTSQDLEQTSSKAKQEDGEGTVLDPTATVNTHVKRIEILSSHLREFADTEKQSSGVDDSARTGLNELHHYLDGLIYSKPGYGPVTGYGAYSSPGMDSNGTATGVGKGEEDAITSFKAEIRGVKGALLSARNFPASRGRVGAGLSLGR